MTKTWTIVGLALLATLVSVSNIAAQEAPPPPPWLMTGTHGIEVGYTLDEAVVRRLLPKGIEPAKEMTGGFELYVSPGGYGISPYSAFIVFVDVEGMDMPDGRKGRWMLMGRYGPSELVAAALKEHYGYPVRAGSVRIEQNGKKGKWIGSANGKDFIEVRIERESDDCKMQSALDHWAGKAASGRVLINRIPNTYCWRDVKLTGVEVRASSDEPLASLQPGNKPVAYVVEWENGAWSFTVPVAKP